MKTAIRLFFLLLVFCVNPIFATEGKVQLKLKEGQKIEFKYINSVTTQHSIPTYSIEEENNWDIEVMVDKKISEQKLILQVKPKRYIYNKFSAHNPNIHFDSMFPPAEEKLPGLLLQKLQYDILCGLSVSMGMDLINNELIIINSDRLEDNIKNRGKAAGLTDEEAENLAKEILASIDIIKNFTQEFLLICNNAEMKKGNLISAQNEKFEVKNATSDLLKVSHRSIVKKEKYDQKLEKFFTFNRLNGFPSEAVITTYNPPYSRENGKKSTATTEIKTFFIGKNSEAAANSVTIDGFIENPNDKKIFVFCSDSPIGETRIAAEAQVDSANRFSVKIPLQREGTLIITNPGRDDNDIKNVIARIFYAEPGDHITILLSGQPPELKTEFQGDRIRENNLLLDLQNRLSLVQFQIFDGHNPFVAFYHDSLLVSIKNFAKEITSETLSGYNTEDLPVKFLNFINHEIPMLKLAMATNILDILESRQLFGSPLKPEFYSVIQELENFVEDFKICKHYDENGYYSKTAVPTYTRYFYNRNFKYASPNGGPNKGRSYGYSGSIPYYTPVQINEYINLILAGSSLAHEKAKILSEDLTYSRKFNKYDSRESWYSIQTKLYDEIVKSSKDTILNEFLESKLQNAREFLDGKTYKKRIFLNQKGDTLSISDFFGKKPTIVKVSGSWAAARYFFDDLSEKYPDANFIYIVEGTDFEEWKDYISRAAPKAFQLFLKKDNYSLQELFSTPKYTGRAFVFDKNGKVIEYEADLDQIGKYIEKAQNPPEEKKGPDKSTMLGIICFLGGSLLIFMIVFLVFKYRVKQRLKKQEQEKRLRELQLAAIRAQMNPHFLFNSLNSVQNLIQKNRAREAHLYLSDFASLIRKVLKNSKREEISLTEELETLNQYIQLEKFRFDFDYEINVDPEIDRNHFMVPSMILQPIAENAIIHGLQHKQDNKKLTVSVTKAENRILIVIEDNGIGIKASRGKSASNGMGLKMNEERLKIMDEKYGGKSSFRIIDLSEQGKEGTRVEISIPDEI